MARDVEMERRLLNWARWKVGVSSATLGYASVNYLEEGGNSFQGVKIPLLSVEAEETDRAIKSLEVDLQKTLLVVYVSDFNEAKRKRVLGVGVRAINLRVERAHRLLSAWHIAERHKWVEHRSYNEEVIKSVRR